MNDDWKNYAEKCVAKGVIRRIIASLNPPMSPKKPKILYEVTTFTYF